MIENDSPERGHCGSGAEANLAGNHAVLELQSYWCLAFQELRTQFKQELSCHTIKLNASVADIYGINVNSMIWTISQYFSVYW